MREEYVAHRNRYSYIVSKSLYSTLNVTDDGMTHTWMCAGGPSFVMVGQIVLEHLYSAYNCTFLSILTLKRADQRKRNCSYR